MKIYKVFLSCLFLVVSCDNIMNSDIVDKPGLIFSDNFDQYKFAEWSGFEGHRRWFTITDEQSQSGYYSCRISIQPQKKRMEITKKYIAKADAEYVYSWSFMIDSGFKDSFLTTIIHQFHDFPDFDSGETWDNIKPRRAPLLTIYREGRVYSQIYDPNSNSTRFADVEIKKSEWNHIIYHVYWSTENDGFVSVNLNGTFLTPFNGTDNRYYAPNLFNKEGNYFKVGLYRQHTETQTNIMYVDDFEFYLLDSD